MSERPDSPAKPSFPSGIADRYRVHALLGRGGVASVYRVSDASNGRELALKQLDLSGNAEERAVAVSSFEREFFTLAQLSHPNVIEVYDYGMPSEGAPYYTMELLDGGDLRDRAPLHWREVCRVSFDICSSLCLLHSRRLLHRDISPRNIRCSRDGAAKLIDFGAMCAIDAVSRELIGTPTFTAPESVLRSALDARTDLFSLGATMYYALTRHYAFPARSFAEVLKAWNFKLIPPSAHVAEIPAALDELLQSMLSLELARRPQSSFEVMQRLAAIADLPRSEPEGVSRAYLSAPVLVAREGALQQLRAALGQALIGRGGGLMIHGESGLGRSRLLDAGVLEAKTHGATVLRAAPIGVQADFSLAQQLVQHLLEALPTPSVAQQLETLLESAMASLRPRSTASQATGHRLGWRARFAALTGDPDKLLRGLARFFTTVSRAHPLVLAIDDVHQVDESSAALLAALVDKTMRGKLLIATTSPSKALGGRATSVLARRSEIVELRALDREQTRSLLDSVFGDVPNLALVTQEVFNVARGNPRQIMDLAQHLLDKGLIAYAAGAWTLPQKIQATDMPRSAEAAIAARILALDPEARALGEAQALAFHQAFSRDDYRALRPELDAQAIELALAQLLRNQALVGDGQTYTLASRVWVAAFRGGLDAERARAQHAALAEIYRIKAPLATIHHLFHAGLDERGLDALLARQKQHAQSFDGDAALRMRADRMGPSYLRALQAAEHLCRPQRQRHDLRRWLTALSVSSDAKFYWEAGPLWLEQLEHDSGLSDWRADRDTSDPTARLTRALQHAQARYSVTPEFERVYRVDEAIPLLAEYAVMSVAIGSRTHNNALIASLPPLLEPFASLSPVLHALWQNVLATHEYSQSRYEIARSRWLEVYERLGRVAGAELHHAEQIRTAVAFAISSVEATLGLSSATTWTALVDHDPRQRLSAMSVRKIVRLQQGDWLGADRIRRELEVQALQVRTPQMFNALALEANVYWEARDLVGLRDTIEQLRPLAEAYDGWRGPLRLAEARFDLLRGDLVAAESGFQRCLAIAGDPQTGEPRNIPLWLNARAGFAELLLQTDRSEEALAVATSALTTRAAQAPGVETSELTRSLALIEARRGDFVAANARLDKLIAAQVALGVNGLRLGRSYEARAQVAIWSGDEAAFDEYARHTAREYRHGARSPLDALYEHLMSDAQQRGLTRWVALAQLDAGNLLETTRAALIDANDAVSQALSDAEHEDELARRALRLMCHARAAAGGHLYLVRDGVWTLAASSGAVPASDDLLEQLREYTMRDQERADTITVVAPDSIDQETHVDAVAHAGGVKYELLLLTRTLHGEGKLVGAVAIALSETRIPSLKQAQLLSALAVHLDGGPEPEADAAARSDAARSRKT